MCQHLHWTRAVDCSCTVSTPTTCRCDNYDTVSGWLCEKIELMWKLVPLHIASQLNTESPLVRSVLVLRGWDFACGLDYFSVKATFFKILIHFFCLVAKLKMVSSCSSSHPTELRLRLQRVSFLDHGNFFDLLFWLGDNFDSMRIWTQWQFWLSWYNNNFDLVTILTRCTETRGDVTILTHLVSSAVGQFWLSDNFD